MRGPDFRAAYAGLLLMTADAREVVYVESPDVDQRVKHVARVFEGAVSVGLETRMAPGTQPDASDPSLSAPHP